MRIAIVGGGASGLAAAWLLDAAHEVTLLEAADALGGRVRTLGGKVPCDALPPGVRLDAGVVEFDRLNFPAFHAWMAALDVATPDLPEGGATSLLLASGLRLHSPGALRVERVVCRAHVVDEVCQRVRVRGKPCAEPPREQLVGARDVERVAGDAHVVVAVGVEAHERDLERELAQDAVDGAPLADVPHVVELRVEAVRPEVEGVRVPAGLVVRLEHDDPAPRARHQRGEGEPREPAADHDVVWFAHTLPTRRNARSTGAVDLRGVPWGDAMERSETSMRRSARRSDRRAPRCAGASRRVVAILRAMRTTTRGTLLVLIGALSLFPVLAHPDIPPPDSCPSVGQTCANATDGGATGLPGVCRAATCTRATPSGAVTYACNRCLPSAGGSADSAGCSCAVPGRAGGASHGALALVAAALVALRGARRARR